MLFRVQLEKTINHECEIEANSKEEAEQKALEEINNTDLIDVQDSGWYVYNTEEERNEE